MFIFGFPIALGISAVENGPSPHYLFTLLAVPGPGSTVAQLWPGRLLLGALLFLAYEPQQQLAILSWPIKANSFL